MERKLAAIFSADVKGYSRLMGDDEAATIRTLTAYRAVMTSVIQQHHGRVVDTPGDNLLAEFVSAVDAVQSAVEIQGIAKYLAITCSLDYTYVCSGSTFSALVIVLEISFSPGFAAHLAVAVREVVSIPVLAIKRINDPIFAERVLADGQADMIATTRALIADG